MAQAESKGWSIKNASVKSVHRTVQVSNSINAALLVLCGIMTFILAALDFLTVMAALYVIFFGLLMLMFEARFKCFDKTFFNQFGFMFNPYGRLCFFLFCGTLGVALGVFGYIAAGYTFINMLFNMYVMCVHPEYRKFLKEEEKAKRSAQSGASSPAPPVSASVAVPMTEAVKPKPATTAPTAADDDDPFAQSTSGGDSWEKLWDDNTQRHYYHNHSTGETRWDKP